MGRIASLVCRGCWGRFIFSRVEQQFVTLHPRSTCTLQGVSCRLPEVSSHQTPDAVRKSAFGTADRVLGASGAPVS